jgi:hypothetical protein
MDLDKKGWRKNESAARAQRDARRVKALKAVRIVGMTASVS